MSNDDGSKDAKARLEAAIAAAKETIDSASDELRKGLALAAQMAQEAKDTAKKEWSEIQKQGQDIATSAQETVQSVYDRSEEVWNQTVDAVSKAVVDKFDKVVEATEQFINQEIEIAKHSGITTAAIGVELAGIVIDEAVEFGKTVGPAALDNAPKLIGIAVESLGGPRGVGGGVELKMSKLVEPAAATLVYAEAQLYAGIADAKKLSQEVHDNLKIDSDANIEQKVRQVVQEESLTPRSEQSRVIEDTELNRAKDTQKMDREMALHEQHIREIHVLVPKAQQVVDIHEERTLSPDEQQKRHAFQQMKFEDQAQTLKQAFARQDREMTELSGASGALDPQMRADQIDTRQNMKRDIDAERYEATQTVCANEAAKTLETANAKYVQSYRDKVIAETPSADQVAAKVESYEKKLADDLPRDLQTVGKTFHTQTFPEIARSGPGLGPGGTAPGGGF